MSTAEWILNDASPWQSWSLGTESLRYSPTGAGVSVPRGPAMPLNSFVGTGGGSADELVSEDRTNATSVQSWDELFERIGEQTTTGTTEVLGSTDLIAEIKTTLGVSVTDLASIAGVSRQAIYDWIGGGQVNDANYERLLKLREVCIDWQSRANRPLGRLLRTKNAEGNSLLDLLRQDQMNRSLIACQLEALAIKAAEQDEQRKMRNARLGPLSEKDQYENALTHAIPATDS